MEKMAHVGSHIDPIPRAFRATSSAAGLSELWVKSSDKVGMLPASALKAMLCSENSRLGKRPKFMGISMGISMLDDDSSQDLGESLEFGKLADLGHILESRGEQCDKCDSFATFQCTIKIRIIHRWMESAPYLGETVNVIEVEAKTCGPIAVRAPNED